MSDTVNPYSERRTRAPGQEPSLDDVFDVLTEARRRAVLSVLSDRGSSMDVEALAAAVAAREHDVDRDVVPESTLEEVPVAALVDYDRDARTVSTTDATDAVPIDV